MSPEYSQAGVYGRAWKWIQFVSKMGQVQNVCIIFPIKVKNFSGRIYWIFWVFSKPLFLRHPVILLEIKIETFSIIFIKQKSCDKMHSTYSGPIVPQGCNEIETDLGFSYDLWFLAMKDNKPTSAELYYRGLSLNDCH